MFHRRSLLAGLGASATLAIVPARAAPPVTIKIGALRLIHSITPYFYSQFAPAGVTIEVLPFESPTESKNAVVTKSVDFAACGIAAAMLGAAAGEPVVVIACQCNGGMGIIAKTGNGIATIKDLKGKRVGIWPGSTQEVFVLERLHMEGMSVADITPVRISFSEMHIALARGDIDAYVGAEPGPGVSLSTGIGTLVEYPYSTAMGSLNMILSTHHDTIEHNPDLIRTLLEIHRKATDFANKNPDAVIAMAMMKLGQKRPALEKALPNVELKWQFGPPEVKQAKTYAEHMLALKQIKRLPDFSTFIDTTFVAAMSAQDLKL